MELTLVANKQKERILIRSFCLLNFLQKLLVLLAVLLLVALNDFASD